jgi:hypothetical protein
MFWIVRTVIRSCISIHDTSSYESLLSDMGVKHGCSLNGHLANQMISQRWPPKLTQPEVTDVTL